MIKRKLRGKIRIIKKEKIYLLADTVKQLFMKQIILLCLLVLSFQNTAFGQDDKEEYFELIESYTDSIGNLIEIPMDSLEYHRITNKDYSKFGYSNKKGEIVIMPGKYESLNVIDKYGMILARKNGKEGYIDITEKVLIPFIYDEVGVFSEKPELAPVIKDGKQGFINRKGEIVVPLEYDENGYVTYFHDPGVAIVTKNSKYGVIDPQSNIIIPFIYDKIVHSDNKDCFIVTKGKDWATFSYEGQQISEFDNLILISNRESANNLTNRKNLPFLITTEEREKKRLEQLYIQQDYLQGNKLADAFIKASIEGAYAYIDKNKQIIIPFGEYNYTEPFGLGRKAIVAKQGVYGIIDEYGKVVLPLEYHYIECPSSYSTIYLATKGETVTVFDENLNKIPVNGIISYTSEDSYIYISNIHGKKGLLDYSGIQTIPFEYDILQHARWNEGLIAKKNGKYGYISNKNEIIKPFEYKAIYNINELVFVNFENKAGIFDKKGDIKLPFEYDSICNAYYSNIEKEEIRYTVIKDGKVGTVDIYNNVTIPIIYDGLSGWVEYGPKAHFAKKDGKYGLISYDGQILIPLEYEYVDLPTSGVIVVRKNGKYGAISWENKEIMPFIYDMIINDMPIEDIGDTREPKLISLLNGIWSYHDQKGEIIQTNVPKDKIMDNYSYRLNRGEPSNEFSDFDMKQARKP